MKFLEAKLAGGQRLVLTVEPDAIQNKIAMVKHARPAVKLWTRPYETYELRGRENQEWINAANAEIYPLQGLSRPVGETSAERKAVTRREESREWADTGRRAEGDRACACPWAWDECCSLPAIMETIPAPRAWLQEATTSEPDQDEVMQQFLAADPGANEARRQQIAEQAKSFVREIRRSDQAAKLWIGQIKAETGVYNTAIDYFTNWENPLGKRRSTTAWPACTEAQGDSAKAIQTYREDESPQRHGNLLRARRLEKLSQANPAASKADPD